MTTTTKKGVKFEDKTEDTFNAQKDANMTVSAAAEMGHMAEVQLEEVKRYISSWEERYELASSYAEVNPEPSREENDRDDWYDAMDAQKRMVSNAKSAMSDWEHCIFYLQQAVDSFKVAEESAKELEALLDTMK